MEEEKGEELTHYIHQADVFRTKVFGIQDGLIGVGAIVLGAAGFSHDAIAVLIAGLIATIGQAFSMGIGEYISTRVRMQVIQNEIRKEKYQLEKFPEMEKQELIDFYMKKGFSKDVSEKIAEYLLKNKNVALEEMLMHELKVFPEEFESPVKLGFLMSLYLIIGGLIPIFPFAISVYLQQFQFNYALITSILLVILTLGIFGILGTKYTGLRKYRGAFEQIGTGMIALIGSYIAGMLLAHFISVSYLP
ncbi:VIT1/CCC1 transporter family protein [Sulfolobus tengchongensis]|uniref:VIT1/CCC1 transporter family protein n=1 Tax=Sulfolobus tengchongensis TaxID=207809 RepID=A0AAX4KZ05_9CREN